MRKRILILLSLIIFIHYLNPAAVVQAAERVGYSVQALLPENQLDQSVSYFNLRAEPETEQELALEVFNHESEEMTFRVDVFNASTNSNGLIVYEEQEEPDPSLTNPVTELVVLEEEKMTVPAGEARLVKAILNTPEEEFDGIKLGGIHVERVFEEQEAEKGVNIENRYAYVVGLQLSENDSEIDPELHLLGIEPQLINYRPAVIAKIQNSEPIIIEDVTIQAKVFSEDGSERLKEKTQENIKMAPNSTMDFILDFDHYQLEAGNYLLEMKASSGDDVWEWKETFRITEETERSNEKAAELVEGNKTDHLNWYMIGIIILAVIILILIMYIRRLKKSHL